MNDYTKRQNRMWEELSDKSKKYVLNRFNEAKIYDNEREMDVYIDMFGEQNLNDINTWEDYVRVHGKQSFMFNLPDVSYQKKIEADYKIAKLIEVGYGGLLSDEDWRLLVADKQSDCCYINCVVAGDNVKFDIKHFTDVISNHHIIGNRRVFAKCFVVFKDMSFAKRFLDYSENIQLLKDSFMIYD